MSARQGPLHEPADEHVLPPGDGDEVRGGSAIISLLCPVEAQPCGPTLETGVVGRPECYAVGRGTVPHSCRRALCGLVRPRLALPNNGRVRLGAQCRGLPPAGKKFWWDILDEDAHNQLCGRVSAGAFHDLLICLPTGTSAAWQRAVGSRGAGLRTRQSPLCREGVSIRG